MTQQRKTCKNWTREFKLEAVRLMETSDRPAAEIARGPGIPRNCLYKWKEQLAKEDEQAFSGAGRPKQSDQSELAA